MARKPSNQPWSPAKLVVPRLEARQKIEQQIMGGHEIANRTFHSEADVDVGWADFLRWTQYNRELLSRLFDNSSLLDEYNSFYGGSIPINPTFAVKIDNLLEHIRYMLNRLISVHERLDLIPEPEGTSAKSSRSSITRLTGRSVFIVHGHDDAMREAVARFVERLGLSSVILAEQPNAGRTIIEKLEGSADVGFAVVLLSPDDVGASQDALPTLNPRARQNVILELGFFVATLGRSHVCALYKDEVELPSDYLGVMYVLFDRFDAWKLKLAREIKEAGIEVDLNRAV